VPNLVSVVIPTYNHAHFLRGALESVLDQSYTQWEAVIIDNHSEDNTEDVVKGFSDPRLRLLKIRNNGVIAASRNLGIRESTGQWIAFLDSDDCWYPRKLEVIMAAAITDGEWDVLSNDEARVETQTGVRRINRYGPYCEKFYEALLTKGNRLSTSATVIRRDFLRRHDLAFDERPQYVTVEDYALWLELARHGARFKFIPEVHGEFVVHGGNNSGRLWRHLKSTETLLRDHVFTIQRFESSPERLWKRISARFRLAEAKRLAKARQFRLAVGLTLQAVMDSPRGVAGHALSTSRRMLGH
jgi:glycosyltransferase involved in cell wall biosynthesis